MKRAFVDANVILLLTPITVAHERNLTFADALVATVLDGA